MMDDLAFILSKCIKIFSILIFIISMPMNSPAGVWSSVGRQIVKPFGKESVEQSARQGARQSARGVIHQGAHTGVGCAIGGNSTVLAARLATIHGMKPGFQAHHIIPVSNKFHRTLNKISFDMDCVENGIFLPGAPGLHPTLPVHRGNHPGYTQAVLRALDSIPKHLSVDETRCEVMKIIQQFRKKLESGKSLYESQGGIW